MVSWPKILIILGLSLTILGSCQSASESNVDMAKRALSSDNGQLDLSQYTMEQQKAEKRDAEALMLEARSKRIVISPNELEEISSDISLNIAVYARSSSNNVGEKIYRRIKMSSGNIEPCLRFKSNEDAQRYFLLKGGPKKDIWGLDPDGDGFACDWDPKYFRLIKLNTD